MSNQGYLEDDLREWVLEHPEQILGEELLIIGQEVRVAEIGDAIDLLAIDRDGNSVIIELKRGRISGNTEFQALKYAAFVSHWTWDEFSDQYENFKSAVAGSPGVDEDDSFNDVVDQFCNEDYEFNHDQRLLLVGEGLAQRLDHVARWLSERDVDITVVEVQLYEDDGRLYLDAEQTVPTPTKANAGPGPSISKQPWKTDGRSWHTETVPNESTGDRLVEAVSALKDLSLLDGPYWEQKKYIAFKRERKNSVLFWTQKTQFTLRVYDISTENLDAATIADNLAVQSEQVEIIHEGADDQRPGVSITYDGRSDADIDAIVTEVRRLLSDVD